MFRLLIAGGIFLMVSSVQALSLSMNGNWIGAIQMKDDSITFNTSFYQQDNIAKGTINIPAKGLHDKPLIVKANDVAHPEFVLETDAENFDFKGHLQDGKISGDVHMGEGAGTFEMVRLARSEPLDYQQYFGIYQIDPHRFVYIRTWDELGKNQLTYFDSSGNAGSLYPVSSNSFFSGPAILDPLPERVRVRFEKEPGGVRLFWTEGGLPEKSAKKLGIHEEEVHFQNGDVTLAGTFFMPASSGPYPALVLVHGSNSVTRDFFGPIAYHFVQNGIAVLAYDKRGIGESAGNWMEATFSDLAKDALAGVQFLETRKEIDSRKIGLWGISQGGWIAPLAASLSKDVTFLILVSAPAVTPAEQQMQSLEAEYRIQNVPEEKIKNAIEETKAQFNTLRLEQSRIQLEREVEKLKQQGSQTLLLGSGLDNPLFLLFYRRILDYDPLPVLEKTVCPVLIIYGDLDATVPMKGNKDKIETALKKAENEHYSVVVIPKGNHALLESTTGSSSEWPRLKRFVPGFFDAITEWIKQL
jgi:uncharacterized protein